MRVLVCVVTVLPRAVRHSLIVRVALAVEADIGGYMWRSINATEGIVLALEGCGRLLVEIHGNGLRFRSAVRMCAVLESALDSRRLFMRQKENKNKEEAMPASNGGRHKLQDAAVRCQLRLRAVSHNKQVQRTPAAGQQQLAVWERQHKRNETAEARQCRCTLWRKDNRRLAGDRCWMVQAKSTALAEQGP